MPIATTAIIPGTVLGFDFGHRRIGVAVGQHLTSTVRPLITLTARAQRPDWQAIDAVIAEWQPNLLVVGLPRHADGSPNTVTRAALRFSHQLQNRYGLPTDTIDEHLSSYAAEALMRAHPQKRKRVPRTAVDSIAAALILESWFAQRRTNPSAGH